VIFLDLAPRICLWRVIKRLLQRNNGRPDMADGCRERFDLKFLGWVWNYKKRSRPKIVNLIRENTNGRRIIWLHSNTEVERFFADVSPN
jgi:adenylate kinase family enzyme